MEALMISKAVVHWRRHCRGATIAIGHCSIQLSQEGSFSRKAGIRAVHGQASQSYPLLGPSPCIISELDFRKRQDEHWDVSCLLGSNGSVSGYRNMY